MSKKTFYVTFNEDISEQAAVDFQNWISVQFPEGSYSVSEVPPPANLTDAANEGEASNEAGNDETEQQQTGTN